MYLVALWMAAEAPSSSGRHRMGEAKVLSTTTGTLASLPNRTIASRSQTRQRGLLIVSQSRSAAPRRADSTAARSPRSTSRIS